MSRRWKVTKRSTSIGSSVSTGGWPSSPEVPAALAAPSRKGSAVPGLGWSSPVGSSTASAATEEELRALGIDAAGIGCHLGSLDDVRALVAATGDRFGGIDVIVNNAANALAEPIGSFSEAGFTKSMEVNVKGPIFLVQEALPHLRASEHASVINLVSAGAWLFSATVAHYAAAKSAMVSYTKALAAGLAPDGIRVNAIAPGSVDTDMVRQTGPVATSNMAAACLMRRVAQPHEMVGPALFLASDASSYVTGTVVHADGGLVTR